MKVKDENLRDEILKYAKEIANQEGYEKINIRQLAQKAGIATGTVYNYFSNKDEILLAMTDEYWYLIVNDMKNIIQNKTFSEQLREIYTYLLNNISQSASELMNNLKNVQQEGRKRMSTMHELVSKNIIFYLEQDNEINSKVWTDIFTKEKFANFIVQNIMFSLRAKSSNIDFLIEIVKKILY